MADAHSPSDAPQRLTAIRGEIDSVDQELLALFNRSRRPEPGSGPHQGR